MFYKYIYINRGNGMKIKSNEKLDDKKFVLVKEFRDTSLNKEISIK